jgi:hypothetical protein
MACCYENEMNSDVQQDIERNLLRAVCLEKELGKNLELKWQATEREIFEFSAARYRGSYSSVRGALCHRVTIPPTFRNRTILCYSWSSSTNSCPVVKTVCVMQTQLQNVT